MDFLAPQGRRVSIRPSRPLFTPQPAPEGRRDRGQAGAQPASRPLFTPQPAPGIADQWHNPDVFRGHRSLGVPVITPSPLGRAEEGPVGGAVAVARVAGGINKGLKQERLDPGSRCPVMTQSFGAGGENPGSQIGDMDPRQDEESRIVDDAAQLAFPLSMRPANPEITRGDFPGSTGKADAGQRPGVAGDVVTQLEANRMLVAEVVVGGNGRVPLPRCAAIGCGYGMESESGEEVNSIRDSGSRIRSSAAAPGRRLWSTGNLGGWRQGDDACLMHP